MISTHGLAKTYRGRPMSTTIGMLTTLVRPTAGRGHVGGHDVARDPVGVRRCVGVVSQRNSLDPALCVADNLIFRGRYRVCVGVLAGAALGLGWLATARFERRVIASRPTESRRGRCE